MATPIGVLGGVRATLFAGIGGAYFEGQPFKFYTNDTTLERPVVGYNNLHAGQSIYGPAVPVDGLRLVDGRGSYGISLSTFALGFPLHFDWSWRTLLNKEWEDVTFHLSGGSESSAGRSSRCGLATTGRIRPQASVRSQISDCRASELGPRSASGPSVSPKRHAAGSAVVLRATSAHPLASFSAALVDASASTSPVPCLPSSTQTSLALAAGVDARPLNPFTLRLRPQSRATFVNTHVTRDFRMIRSPTLIG